MILPAFFAIFYPLIQLSFLYSSLNMSWWGNIVFLLHIIDMFTLLRIAEIFRILDYLLKCEIVLRRSKWLVISSQAKKRWYHIHFVRLKAVAWTYLASNFDIDFMPICVSRPWLL